MKPVKAQSVVSSKMSQKWGAGWWYFWEPIEESFGPSFSKVYLADFGCFRPGPQTNMVYSFDSQPLSSIKIWNSECSQRA